MRLRIAAVLVAFLAFASFRPDHAKAAAIPIVNGDFQSSLTLNLGTSTLGYYASSAVGWTITGTGGTFQPAIGAGKPFTSGDPNNRIGFLNGNADVVDNVSLMEQALGSSFAADYNYLLTFDIGHRNLGPFPSLATAVLFDATTNTDLLSVILSDPGSNSFSTQSLFLSASLASTAIGNNIGIRFTSNNSQLNIDNVTLQAISAVPVPGALLLFVSGLGVLGWGARRHKQAERHADA